jgi:hypothetical protein
MGANCSALKSFSQKSTGAERIMMDWQQSQGGRNADPNWEADWHRGMVIGLLVIVVLAMAAVGTVSVQLGNPPDVMAGPAPASPPGSHRVLGDLP